MSDAARTSVLSLHQACVRCARAARFVLPGGRPVCWWHYGMARYDAEVAA